MIPRAYITEWRNAAPWHLNEQVEQDLLISRALVEVYSDDFLAERLAFRGGTALHKLYLSPPVRYSEDIDLVQIRSEPIGGTLDRLRSVLEPWLGKARSKQARRNTTLVFRCSSEVPPVVQLRLKLEINCREHFTVEGLTEMPYAVSSRWFEGECSLVTYTLEELLATKMRALYQRRKGRDLFDLWHALSNTELDPRRTVAAFTEYIRNEGSCISRKEYAQNVESKLDQHDSLHDTDALLRSGTPYRRVEAWSQVHAEFVLLL